jgi:hypothetical protein
MKRRLLLLAAGWLLGIGQWGHAATQEEEFKAIVESQFPGMEMLERNEIKLREMESDMPKDEWMRLSGHPQWVTTDVNDDGRLDFAVLAKKSGTQEAEAGSSVVICLNDKGAEYRCSIVDELKPFRGWEYLDVVEFREPPDWCEPMFPQAGRAVGSVPVLGCCVTAYVFLLQQNRYAKCAFGD